MYNCVDIKDDSNESLCGIEREANGGERELVGLQLGYKNASNEFELEVE